MAVGQVEGPMQAVDLISREVLEGHGVSLSPTDSDDLHRVSRRVIRKGVVLGANIFE
jgi:hypothetical protein